MGVYFKSDILHLPCPLLLISCIHVIRIVGGQQSGLPFPSCVSILLRHGSIKRIEMHYYYIIIDKMFLDNVCKKNAPGVINRGRKSLNSAWIRGNAKKIKLLSRSTITFFPWYYCRERKTPCSTPLLCKPRFWNFRVLHRIIATFIATNFSYELMDLSRRRILSTYSY